MTSPSQPGSADGNDHRHAEARSGDIVLRAITDDDAFRVIVASTTLTVRDALLSQSLDAETAPHFGALLTGMVMVRETMSPHHRVQGVLKGIHGRSTIVVDAHPDGATRGLVQLHDDVDRFAIGPGSLLQVMRSKARGETTRSITQPPPDGDVSAALMTYMQESEQITSVIATGAHVDGNEIVFAGGYVIQLLPDAPRGSLMIMTERLESLPPIDKLLQETGGDATKLLEELLFGMPFAQLDRRPVFYRCQCSREAVVGALSTLSRAELAELVATEDVIELTCDYCNTGYKVGRQHLQGLLTPS